MVSYGRQAEIGLRETRKQKTKTESKMKRTTLVVYRRSKGAITTRLPAHLISTDSNGRVCGRGNMYLTLGAESNADALAEWTRRAKIATSGQRQGLADELEPRGLVIARHGDNGDAVVMWDDEFAQTDLYRDYMARIEAERKAREEEERRTVTISLVTRGWGDYGMVQWRGDITRPTTDIVAECRAKLAADRQKDGDMTDAEITNDVKAAKTEWAAKNAKREAAAAHVEDCKRHARKTGKRVEIRRYATECHDPNEECSLDIATEWAMPDGSVTTTYQHTW